jgi:hypothetical protein
MTTILDVVNDDAKEDLVRGNIIELISMNVQYPPAHHDGEAENPGDKTWFLSTAFENEPPWLAEEMEKIRVTCNHAGDDLKGPLHKAMLEARQEQVRTIKELRKFEGLEQFLPYVMTGVNVWELVWTAWIDDDGIFYSECEEWIDESVIDRETCILVRERMERVNDEMRWVTGKLGVG